MKKIKLYSVVSNIKNDNIIHIETDYVHLANPMHLEVQKTYRTQVYEDKTKFNRNRNKRNFQRELANY